MADLEMLKNNFPSREEWDQLYLDMTTVTPEMIDDLYISEDSDDEDTPENE